jgi:hypothetical protein
MGIIMISSSVIQPPNGTDVTTMEELKASIHLFEPKHFLFPFLANALGTLFVSLISAIIAVNNKMIFAIVSWNLFFDERNHYFFSSTRFKMVHFYGFDTGIYTYGLDWRENSFKN